MSEFAYFRFMSSNMLTVEEQQHKDEIISLTEQVLDAKGIECDSKISKISEEQLGEILEGVRRLRKRRKSEEEDREDRQKEEPDIVPLEQCEKLTKKSNTKAPPDSTSLFSEGFSLKIPLSSYFIRVYSPPTDDPAN